MAKGKIQFHNPIEKHLDTISCYHFFLFSLIFLSKVPIFWHVMGLLFLAPPMDFHCYSTEVHQSSKNYCPCEEPTWNRSVFTETLQTKYGIHCERSWLIGFSHRVLHFGCLLGCISFGFLSDKFGRLPMFALSVFIIATFGCLVVIMPTIASCTLMRLLEGVGIGGAVVTGYVLCVEYCGVRHREVVTSLLHVPLNVGQMSLAGVSYLLRHCDEFQLAISMPLFLFVALNWCILESPKWLMDNNYIDKAASVMEKLSKYNTDSGEIETEIEEFLEKKAQKSHRKMQFWHIFHHKKLSLNFICIAIIYFVCSLGFHGVSRFVGQMSRDIHVNVALSGALLLVGTLVSTFLILILWRKTFLMAIIFLSGGLMLAVVLIPSQHFMPRLVIAGLCSILFYMSFVVIFLYGVELFPTAVRNSVLGCLSVMSRVGQMAAPAVNQLPETVSGSIFSGLAILGGVLYFPLPETKNVELPSTLEESMALSQGKTNLHQVTEQSIQI